MDIKKLVNDFFDIGDTQEVDTDEITQKEIDEYKEKLRSQTETSIFDEARFNSIANASKVDPPLEETIVMPRTVTKDDAPLQNDVSQSSGAAQAQSAQPVKLIMIEPKSIDECRKLVDNIKADKLVIVNFEHAETDLAQKMFEFLMGATYALSGTSKKLSSNIIVFASSNVDIASSLGNTLYSK